MEMIQPFLKWAGGKRQLLDSILPLVPDFKTYCEPFLGGGAVFFAIKPKRAILNDYNSELINCYNVVQNDINALIKSLRRHRNEKRYYLAVRNLDRKPEKFKKLTPVQRASRFIYLNRVCFNGMHRLNSKGYFNSAFGAYDNPDIVNEWVLRYDSAFLNRCKLKLCSGDFSSVLNNAKSDWFCYIDPPYDPVCEENYVKYNALEFNHDDQRRLKETCDELTKRGVKFLLSNSDTEFMRDLYKDYSIQTVKAKRLIASNVESRAAVNELLIKNY